MTANNMWMIWKRDTYGLGGLHYGQTVDVLEEYPGIGKCDVATHDPEPQIVCIPTAWLYFSDMGYARGTSYEQSFETSFGP